MDIPLAAINPEGVQEARKDAFKSPLVREAQEELGCSPGDDFMKAIFLAVKGETPDELVMEVECEGVRTWLHTQGNPPHHCTTYSEKPIQATVAF